jgi:hypothetical protein
MRFVANRIPGRHVRKQHCHPEARVFCGPKDLCNLLAAS